MAGEKFDIGKFIRGFNLFNGENLGKAAKVVIIAITCILAWNFLAVFTQKQNVNKPNIKVEKDGNLTYNVIQNEQKRRVELFGGGGVSFDGKTSDNNRYLIGGGVKW